MGLAAMLAGPGELQRVGRQRTSFDQWARASNATLQRARVLDPLHSARRRLDSLGQRDVSAGHLQPEGPNFLDLMARPAERWRRSGKSIG